MTDLPASDLMLGKVNLLEEHGAAARRLLVSKLSNSANGNTVDVLLLAAATLVRLFDATLAGGCGPGEGVGRGLGSAPCPNEIVWSEERCGILDRPGVETDGPMVWLSARKQVEQPTVGQRAPRALRDCREAGVGFDEDARG